MSISSKQEANNVIHTFEDNLTGEDIQALFSFNIKVYNELGDAMGIIVDVSNIKHMSLSSVRTAQGLANKLKAKLPLAIVGNTDSFLYTLAQTISVVARRQKGIIAFLDDRDTAKTWIENWFKENNLNRSELVGQVSVIITED